MKYIIEVEAHKIEHNYKYGYSSDDEVKVTKAELFEAISKYLQVKGFTTSVLSVTKAKDDSVQE